MNNMPRAVARAPFPLHCGHVLALITHKIYTSILVMRNNIMHHQLEKLDSPSVITFPTERPQSANTSIFYRSKCTNRICRCTNRIPWYHQNQAYTKESCLQAISIASFNKAMHSLLFCVLYVMILIRMSDLIKYQIINRHICWKSIIYHLI